MWATVGALFTALTVYILVKWVAGPNFARVPTGPDEPPTWMKSVLMTSQFILPAAAVLTVYILLYRPWRRERRITFDGLFCIALLIVSVWDSLSVYLQPWFSYNSYLLNWGSPILELPGALSPHGPGMAIAWSVPVLPAFYVGILPWIAMGGCALLRAFRRRFSHLNTAALMALLFISALIFDVVLEGVVFLPLGFWSYAGGLWPIINGGKYYQQPLNDLLHTAFLFVALTAFRYFKNDRGETIVERGAADLSGGTLKRTGMRALAIIAMAHVILWGTWHLPNAIWGANSRPWPEDVTRRSYLTNQCGPHFNRACPGPDVPLSRPGAGYVDWEGRFVPPQQ